MKHVFMFQIIEFEHGQNEKNEGRARSLESEIRNSHFVVMYFNCIEQVHGLYIILEWAQKINLRALLFKHLVITYRHPLNCS